MIDITDYTSYADIRTVLGLDSLELSDTTLALPTYASALQRALRNTVDTGGKSIYEYYAELSVAPVLTDEEDTMLGLIKEFSTYTVAVACLPGLSLLVKKTESDGKATVTRFSAESTFKDVVANVTNILNEIKTEILTNFGIVTTYNQVSLLTKVEPDTDPVVE